MRENSHGSGCTLRWGNAARIVIAGERIASNAAAPAYLAECGRSV
jgi:hypothetical protein